ncbi:uncharacterized protein MONBRDRAFT_36162 [Monosiga brevicollis MX1]|uniref:START domain-containing protein n=1 Tax=Monosiga brevicollis TaxID=81824 RepID=A9UTH3_MONBE|nr:uncharacterized protein MONBRDRAFT_36162 [Monosiga brevicollis MX1]EDQ91493.1 predicted protein [Monosiga brevicollis MX1]|eukprot:XP_001743915.1 hypothetical protein [Monosiga brevicollis MX1]
MLEIIQEASPDTTPGRVTRYHILSFGWLVGGLVEAITHQPFAAWVQDNIAKPLGLEEEMSIGLGDGRLEKLQSRIATLCNGFFVSPDGETPSEDELRRMMQQLREIDQTQKQIELEEEQRREAQGAEAPNEPHEVLPASNQTKSGPTPPVDDPFEVWPPACEIKSTQYDALIEKLQREVEHECFAGAEDGWTLHSRPRNIEIYKKSMPGSNAIMVRGNADIDAPPAAVFEVMREPTKKGQWNSQFAQLDVVEEFDEVTTIIRDEYKPIWPVSGRDFCMLQAVRFSADGSYIVSNKSIEHPDCPAKPGMVTNAVATDQPLAVANIRDLLANVQDFSRYETMLQKQRLVEAAPTDEETAPPTLAPANGDASDFEPEGGLSMPEARSDAQALEAANTMEAEADSTSDFDLSRLLTADPCIYNAPMVRRACIPSANGHFSARAVAKFYASLVGEVDGVRLLDEATMTEACRLQASEQMGMRDEPMRWGLGFQKYTRQLPNGKQVDGPFGHLGLGGSVGFADPTCELSMAVSVNRLALDRECSERLVQTVYSALGLGELAFA